METQAKTGLIVIDMQADFVTGALGTPEARAILPKVVAKLAKAKGDPSYSYFAYTLDVHSADYLNTQEGRRLPIPHCLRGAPGCALVEEVAKALPQSALCFEKGGFGSLNLASSLPASLTAVELMGVCTDICVITNALSIKAARPELTVRVLSGCCAGVTPEQHSTALKAMAACQIDIVEENPWEAVALSDYEGHMASADVGQLAAINAAMAAQLTAYPVSSAMVLGVGPGTGLGHAAGAPLTRLYGVDVNEAYLEACKARYGDLGGKLTLLKRDLSNISEALPPAELVVADLLVEYIGVQVFAKRMAQMRPLYISCLIQESTGGGFVSDTPYQAALAGIGTLHVDVERAALCAALREAGYLQCLVEETALPGNKRFVRLDFKREGRVFYRLPLLAVQDVARAKAFYASLFGQRVSLDLGRNVTFDGGFAIQEDFPDLLGFPAAEMKARPKNMELYFEVEDFDGFLEALKVREDIAYLHPPKTYEWLQRVVRFYDPDGHLIEAGEAMFAIARRLYAKGYSIEEIADKTQHPAALVKAWAEGAEC